MTSPDVQSDKRAHAVRSAALLCVSLALGGAGPDDNRTDIGTVRATGGPSDRSSASPTPGSAAAVAPSRPPPGATQPTSVIGQDYIKNNAVSTQNYDNIIKFSPSVQNVEPTGAGLQQNFQETIRGFRYTQFNSTFDGLVLPGTISSFAPQTGAYFMAHAIDSVSVDRGPGTASQIGYATFGGTVAVTLASPSNTFGINPYATFGSWGVKQQGLRLDSGAIPQLGGARGLLDLSHVEGDGYLTGTSTLRNNAYSKIEVPIGDNTVITAVGMYNYARTHTSYGATLNQIRTLGPNYALNGDPLSQAYTGYNVDNYYTDFDYVGLKSSFDNGWSIDDKLYTISYYHNGTKGLDPNGTTPNLNGTFFVNGVRTAVTNNVQGVAVHSDFRSVGNTLKISKDTAFGQFRTGIWLDYNAASSYQANIDLSANGRVYTRTATASPYRTLYNTTLGTVQPFIEFAATPLPGLTITPGVKYTYVTRGLDATIIGSAPSTAPRNQNWDSFQPSIDAHYEIMDGLFGYVQVAKGFLAPPLNTLLVPAANAPSSLKAQSTVNYQIGTTFQNDRFAAGFDMYYIDYQNYIAARSNNIGTIYTNNGGAVFKGIETEGTAKLGQGVSLYANATVNDATYNSSGFPVALNPRSTAAAGPIFERDGAYGSLLWKYIGPQYVLDGSGPGVHATGPIKGYNNVDFSAGYTLVLPQLEDRKLNFRVNLFNVFNNQSLTGMIGTTANNQILYTTNPGRGVFVSLSASL